MQRFLRTALSILLTVVTAAPAFAAPAPSNGNWNTRGGSEWHQQRADSPLGTIRAYEAWTVELGVSASQPLYVDGEIYHLAGNSLYRLNPSGISVNEPPVVTKLLDQVNNCVSNGTDYCARLSDVPTQDGVRYRPSTSGVTIKDVAGQKVLYYGTGNNQLCAYRLNDKTGLCMQLGGTEPIVGVPLVMVSGGADFVVVGDKAGNVSVFQGLGIATDVSQVAGKRIDIPGAWVTASAAELGSLDFVWAADAAAVLGGNGAIGRHQITPAGWNTDGSWRPMQIVQVKKPITVPGGVADGLTVDGSYAYVADVAGTMHRIDLDAWSQLSLPLGQAGFTNQIAAVDDKNVYFTIRNIGTSRAQTKGYNGMLVAVDKASWARTWSAVTPDPLNTAPMVWTARDLVLVGDAQGVMRAFSRTDGQPADFGYTDVWQNGSAVCVPQKENNMVKTAEGETPYRGAQDYQVLAGAGTDPVLTTGNSTNGYLLAGVNVVKNGVRTGRLTAYRPTEAFNTAIATPVGPNSVIQAGQTVTYEATTTLEGTADGTVPVMWIYRNNDRSRVRVVAATNAVLSAATKTVRATVDFTPQPGDTDGYMMAVVNPWALVMSPSAEGAQLRDDLRKHLQTVGNTSAANALAGFNFTLAMNLKLADEVLPQFQNRTEIGCWDTLPESIVTAGAVQQVYDDNVREVPVRIQATDLAVLSARGPQNVPFPNDSYTVDLSFANGGRQDVTTTYTVTRDGNVLVNNQPITIPALGNVARTVRVPVGERGTSYQVDVRLNPNENPQEATYDNNEATVITSIAPDPINNSNTFPGGQSEQIMIPGDCATNPDPTSPNPCTNYPNLVSPWYCEENRGDRRCEGY